MSRVPPGQTLTARFPIVGEHRPSPVRLARTIWRLSVEGCVQHPLEIGFEQLLTIAQEEWVVDVHCVTGWSKLGVRWSGVPLHVLLERTVPTTEAGYVRFEAYSDRGHDSSLPLDFACENVLLAYQCDGTSLSSEHGGPVRSIARERYFYKSVKWIRRIELLDEDRLGYWEGKYAYHNHADPFAEERYAPRPMPVDELHERLKRRDFSGSVAVMDERLGAALTGQNLSFASFERAQVKACVFRRCQLAGASFREANLTACRFADVDLTGADFRHCDLEGVQFRQADLHGADFRGALLTATSFRRRANEGKLQGAHFRAADLDALLEGEAEFLRDQGACVESESSEPLDESG